VPAQSYQRDKNGIRLDLGGGMNLMLPPDLIEPGKGYPYLQNVRRNLAGRAVARPPLTINVLSGTIPAPTSMTMMNDPYMGTPGYVLVIGAAGLMYVNATQVASGFSGVPLSFITFRPNASPRPWCYVGDPSMAINIPGYPATIYNNPIAGMVKVRSDNTVWKTGIAEPQVPPSVTLTTPGSSTSWVIYRYVYRSSETGATSNPSPESPAQTQQQTPAPGTPVNGINCQYTVGQYEPDPTAGATDLRTSGGLASGILTDYIIATNFGLNIANNVNITGVEVALTWAGENDGTGLLANVSLYYQNNIIGLTKSPGASNYVFGSPSGNVITQGDQSDTWGATLSPDVVNDSTFGFGVQIATVQQGSTNRSFVYTLELTVYYSNQNSQVLATPSMDPQVDKIDIYRQTPALDNFTYVGTIQNSTASVQGLNDTLNDLAVANNPILEFDNYEPFPSIDLPRKGICTVTAVSQYVSGIEIAATGNGQTNGTYNIPATGGGGGSGAIVQIVIAGGIITTATVTAPGANYTSPPSFIVPPAAVPVGATAGALAAVITPVDPTAPNVTWTSGDLFNVRWLPGNDILIGGYIGSTAQTAWTTYARPISTTQLLVYQSIIDPVSGIPEFSYPVPGANLTFEIAEATLAAQTSPAIWGPTPDNQGSFYFGLDPLNPGDLLWSKGNNFDSAPDTNRMFVTSPSEMLMNGTITSELSTVFSTERFWLIYPNFGDALAAVTGTEGQQWTLTQAAVTRGLYMRYAIAALGSTIAYRAKDCIAISEGGQTEKSITESIYNLFPHGGSSPQPVTIAGNTVYPPDDTKPNAQTITLTSSYVFYNYQDITGTPRTLVYDFNAQGWSVDVYSPTVNCHLYAVAGAAAAPTGAASVLLVGCTDGTVRGIGKGLPGGGVGFPETGSAIIATPSMNGGDARALKRIGDVFFKTAAMTASPIAVALYQTRLTVPLAGYSPTSLSSATGVLTPQIVDFSAGFGNDVDDIAALLTWPLGSGNIIDTWQPDWTELPEIIQDRPSDWTECGVSGNKLIRGMIIEIDTFNAAKALLVERSDSDTLIAPDQTTVTANGQTLVPFTFQPFTAHMLRIVSTDGVPWRLFGPEAITWIVDPWPDYTPLFGPWLNLGSNGAKYVRGILIPMDTNGAAASFRVVSSDGPSVTFSATTPTAHKTPTAFAFIPPIIAHEVQLQCMSNAGLWTDEVEWTADAYPELIPARTPIMEISGPDNKFMQGIKIVADSANNFVGDTNGQPVQFQIYYDGGQVGPLLESRVFNGKQTQVYSFNPPFNAHDVQLVPLQPVRIWMPGMGAGVEDTSKWDFQPAPDSATTWTTEGSSLGLYGWCFIYQINLAYISSTPVTLTVNTDQGSFTLTYPPSTGGGPDTPSKILMKCPRNKWKVVSFSATSTAPFSLWKDLTEVWVRSWGESAEFHKVNPFGGDSSPAASI
jgi:hypothetical protein